MKKKTLLLGDEPLIFGPSIVTLTLWHRKALERENVEHFIGPLPDSRREVFERWEYELKTGQPPWIRESL